MLVQYGHEGALSGQSVCDGAGSGSHAAVGGGEAVCRAAEGLASASGRFARCGLCRSRRVLASSLRIAMQGCVSVRHAASGIWRRAEAAATGARISLHVRGLWRCGDGSCAGCGYGYSAGADFLAGTQPWHLRTAVSLRGEAGWTHSSPAGTLRQVSRADGISGYRKSATGSGHRSAGGCGRGTGAAAATGCRRACASGGQRLSRCG